MSISRVEQRFCSSLLDRGIAAPLTTNTMLNDLAHQLTRSCAFFIYTYEKTTLCHSAYSGGAHYSGAGPVRNPTAIIRQSADVPGVCELRRHSITAARPLNSTIHHAPSAMPFLPATLSTRRWR